ncbi:hypothetical protein [Alicyclobacillus sendaiensis]|uniref:hypothetical protein n=1 Tax=Alicyclobacillus sendaiensis TaxID=192387 RepID=UPI0007828DAF|nr:hypothetical protein [Alicyclobacillus sendaiensis]
MMRWVELSKENASVQRKDRTSWVLAAIVFLAEFVFGCYLYAVEGDIQEDALSRVANAFYVLFSRNPHLGAIGFVWNPLPSMFELPPVALWRWFPPIASDALAGVLVTSLASAAIAFALYRALLGAQVSKATSLVLVLCLALHPFMFLYGANGMSEMIFACFLVICLLNYLAWKDEYSISRLVIAGCALAMAFWARYEAGAFGVGLFAIVLFDALRRAPMGAHARLLMSRRRYRWFRRQERLWYALATALVLLLPAVYSGIVWIALNAEIMHDPLYFLHSAYSNLSLTSVLSSTSKYRSIEHHPVRVLLFMWRRIWMFMVPVGMLLVYRLIRGRLFRWETLQLLLLAASIPSLQFLLLLHGASYGWLRFFFYPLPIAVAWWTYEMRADARQLKRWERELAQLAMAMSVAISGVLTGVVMDRNAEIAPEEYSLIHMDKNAVLQQLRIQQQVAQYINQELPAATILMDSYAAFDVILHVQHPRLRATTIL